jgi:tetratricopeptide (TPR) repeat protein
MTMTKVFISYNSKDRKIAEWLAWQLEEMGHKVTIQAWDFRPGSNFVLEMQKALKESDRTLLVLSQHFLDASFTQPEWAAAFAQDPEGVTRKVLPVRIDKCKPEGLLGQIVYIDLAGKSKDQARETLEKGLDPNRVKPVSPPPFPESPGPGRRGPIKKIKISLSKLPDTSPVLFGREKQLAFLDRAWQEEETGVVTLVAWGGVGKTALVNRWLMDIKQKNFGGARRVYGWSFYSQGAEEGKQASADLFMQETLSWFGDRDPTEGSAVQKGRRLAGLIREEKTLLILDGMEPLQYPPNQGHGLDGQLKDQGLKILLKELAADMDGLCVVTTREKVTGLQRFLGHTVKQEMLETLSVPAGVKLLESLEVRGKAKEMEAAVEAFGGHALALTLLGNFLATVHNGDIRKRDLIPQLTDEEEQGEHAFRVMQSYEEWLGAGPERDILYIMGLFDRPAPGGAIEALRKEPAIPGVTEGLEGLSETKWQYALKRLRGLGLVVESSESGLDCHPLVREYFGGQLKSGYLPGWRKAHTRLYHYYKKLPKKEYPDTLEEMEPLFAAVAHGCAAGLHQEAVNEVYWRRIKRGHEHYSTKKIGAFGADLAAVSHFFDAPWTRPAGGLMDFWKGGVLNWAGFRLRALGRLREAVESMTVSVDRFVQMKKWIDASSCAGSLCELLLTLGRVPEAVEAGRRAMDHADKSGDWQQVVGNKTILADALHQWGKFKEAEQFFREAEEKQKVRQPEYPYLYSVQGHRYCDLLLGRGRYPEVMERAEKSLEWARQYLGLLANALDHLSLGRARLMKVQERGNEGDWLQAADLLDRAVDGLREAGQLQFLAAGLISRTEFHRLRHGFDNAWIDLNEALEIIELGDMKLYLADYHLEASLVRRAEGSKKEAAEHARKAKELIEEMEYFRRQVDSGW